ncbi:hypothetical protein CGC56_01280 [Capnocytophaga canimorsus]|uniref:Uncharacterized protein n=1 Tax=Capnocytophaga canimorsus TaxID=28188 RepID=A0A250G0K5_9FLAO|nr:hypothetical protein CGC56_01280 [Capnocytophaga canimorsus]
MRFDWNVLIPKGLDTISSLWGQPANHYHVVPPTEQKSSDSNNTILYGVFGLCFIVVLVLIFSMFKSSSNNNKR